MTEPVGEAAVLPLLSTVALLQDEPDLGLCRGQVGTVVERLAPDTVQVEFSDDEGRTYALAALATERLLPLLHQPRQAA